MFIVAESSIGGQKEMEDFVILKQECNRNEIGFLQYVCDDDGSKEAAQHTFIKH